MTPDLPRPAHEDQPAEGGRGPATERSTAADRGRADESGKTTPSPEQAERNREEDPPA